MDIFSAHESTLSTHERHSWTFSAPMSATHGHLSTPMSATNGHFPHPRVPLMDTFHTHACHSWTLSASMSATHGHFQQFTSALPLMDAFELP